MLPEDLSADLGHRARHAIWGGYQGPAEVHRDLLELIEYDPATEDLVASDREGISADLMALIAAEESRYLAEQAKWPPITDCDSIRAAFERLESLGILARENTGYDMSDVRDEMDQLARAANSSERPVRGWVTFHGQDIERAVDGGGLFLAYAPIGSDDQEAWRSLGAEIASSLRAEGLSVDWNESPNRRLHLPEIVWRRR